MTLEPVSRCDVANFVSQNGCQLGLAVEVGEHASGDVDITAGQGKGVDQFVVQHGEGVFQFRVVAVAGNLLSNFVHIGLQLGVWVGGHRRHHAQMEFKPQLCFFLQAHQGLGGNHGGKAQSERNPQFSGSSGHS